MKRILVLGIVVVMALSAFGGFAYAQGEHEAVKGDKVIGYGPFGVFSLPSGDTYTLRFGGCRARKTQSR